MEQSEILIPEPIGDVYCHRKRNGKFCMEHHETRWIKVNGESVAHCQDCGRRVRALDISIEHFLNDEKLLNGILDLENEPGGILSFNLVEEQSQEIQAMA